MNIVMAFDGSEEGLQALLSAPELNWLPHQRVFLLGVLPMPGGLFLGEGYVPGEILDEDRRRAQQILDGGVERLRAREFDTEGMLYAGEPVEEICKAAKHLSADLIFVRHPRRLSFAARWWRGWVGASLLEHAPCGILIGVSDKR